MVLTMSRKTTAYRSVLLMRRAGYNAETTEHRNGKFRKDLFNVADCLAFKAGEPAILVQAFHAKEEKNHAQFNRNLPIIREWLLTGNAFELHLWSFKTRKGRKYWNAERRRL